MLLPFAAACLTACTFAPSDRLCLEGGGLGTTWELHCNSATSPESLLRLVLEAQERALRDPTRSSAPPPTTRELAGRLLELDLAEQRELRSILQELGAIPPAEEPK